MGEAEGGSHEEAPTLTCAMKRVGAELGTETRAQSTGQRVVREDLVVLVKNLDFTRKVE